MSGTLTVISDAFNDGDPIPERYAFCAPCAEEHSKMSTNISPQLTWSAGIVFPSVLMSSNIVGTSTSTQIIA